MLRKLGNPGLKLPGQHLCRWVMMLFSFESTQTIVSPDTPLLHGQEGTTLRATHGCSLQYSLPHVLWKVDGSGHWKRHGTAEGARVIMGLKQWCAALQSWPVSLTVPHSSSVMLGKLLRATFPVGDRDMAISYFLDA